MLELNKVYCGDCLELMKEIPDGSIDCVVTDPPYGINIAATGKVGGEKCCAVSDYGAQSWDAAIPTKEVFNEIFRISTNQIIFGGNYMIEHLYNSPCWLVWDKDNTGNFADCELAWTSFKTATRKIRWRWNGMLQENMKRKETRYHPTQKPSGLFAEILNMYTQPGDTILDPFLGSGTTAVAALKTGRNFIGIEIDPKYCEIAQKRVDAELAQTRLDL